MSTTETPNELKEPVQPEADSARPEAASPATADGEDRVPGSKSRWLDYDSHELLEMISELEDERRWARLREGILWAVLLHILLLSAFTWIPKYVFKVPQLKDPFDAINSREDLKYIDVPPDALRALQPKTVPKPVPQKQPRVDNKTLEALNKPTPPPPPAPADTQPTAPAPVQTPPPTPAPTQQAQIETPHPAATPRPNFAMGSQNPADQLRDAMKGSRAPGGSVPSMGGGGLRMHPGAGSGGVEVLTPTNVDLSAWLQRWHHETERTWDPLIPDEVNPPILKSGTVAIRFKVLPNGRLMDGSLTLDGRSGDTALDRAAWGALTGSNYPPLPKEFTGPYIEMRAYFLYNMEPGR